MFDFLKGIAIFITTLTLPVSGLFTHSEPLIKPVLSPIQNISVTISPTPKTLSPTPIKQITRNENSNQYNSLPTTTPSSVSKQEEKYIINKSIPTPTFTPAPSPFKAVAATSPQIIVSSNTPTPPQTPSPTPTISASYADSHCPKVVKIEDNLGNSSTTTSLTGAFKKGSISLLTVKITMADPKNLQLHYQYSSSSITSHNPYLGNWSTNDTYNVDVTDASVGSNKVLFANVDNQDGYGCSGAYYDLPIQFNYDIQP